eukprot:TRINITY_DN15644_c0_g1_i1.p1 TRINITY_DN15644_c0_g1~~TRINITY_DN15644_c0_g1_i1.p1  ORF type:complete len:204 (+),score=10.33 TRINITY_DN15644_c0_g1_i1:137-748(+)
MRQPTALEMELYEQAKAYEVHGHKQEAIQSFAQVLELNPSIIKARSHRVDLLMDLRRYQEAYEELQVLVEEKPQSLRYSYKMSKVAIGLRKYSVAHECLLKLIEAGNFPWDVCLMMGHSKHGLGEIEAAARWYRQAYRMNDLDDHGIIDYMHSMCSFLGYSTHATRSFINDTAEDTDIVQLVGITQPLQDSIEPKGDGGTDVV